MNKIDIAQKIRDELERHAREWESDPETLNSLCGIASLALATAFKKFGYSAEVKTSSIGGVDHCFVVSDYEIWDLTIRQFENWQPKIFIGHKLDDKFGHFEEPINENPEFWDHPTDNLKASKEILKSIGV